MLTLFQCQTIIAQCIRKMTSGNKPYSRNKTFAQMNIISQVRFNGLVAQIYFNPSIGLPYYNHALSDDAFDALGPDSKLSEAEDVLLTAQPRLGKMKNPVL